MSKSKQEIAVKETTAVAEFVAPMEETLESMIYLPRLSLVQKMSSKFIKAGAKEGDLFDGLTSTVVSPKGEHFAFVPLKVRPVLMTEKKDGGKWRFSSSVTLTKANENTPWDERTEIDESNGGAKTIYRDRPAIEVYMLGYAQISSGNEAAMPYVFTFKGASTKFGKGLYTQSRVIASMNGTLHHTKFNVKSVEDKKDDDEFMVAVVSQPTGKLTDSEKTIANLWYKTITSAKVEAVGEEDSEEAAKNTQF